MIRTWHTQQYLSLICTNARVASSVPHGQVKTRAMGHLCHSPFVLWQGQDGGSSQAGDGMADEEQDGSEAATEAFGNVRTELN